MKRFIAAALALLVLSCSGANTPQTEETDTASTRADTNTCDCYAECESIGYECADAASCACGDFLDPMCADGASYMCACLGTCTPDDWIVYYTTCFQFVDQPLAGVVICYDVWGDDCQGAANACY